MTGAELELAAASRIASDAALHCTQLACILDLIVQAAGVLNGGATVVDAIGGAAELARMISNDLQPIVD